MMVEQWFKPRVTDLAAYFDDEITAMPNLITTAATTVGALNSGSITDGFTSIDVGSGAVTTTGTLTYGTLNDGTTDLGSTTAELNIMDGGTSATGTTVADADRVVLNDGGTMVQAAVTDLAAYFDDEITAMPNLITTAATTVGALNSGSITDGFTSIDVGSGAVTTTGTLTYGTLNDGTTDLGSTTAELNIMDGGGGTSATGTTVADADRVVLNDGGTMVQAAVTDLDTYVSGTTKTLTNKTLTAPKFADGGFIADGNGNESVVFQTTASAVNQLDITNGATGGAVILSATGDDTNVDMTLTPQGSGEVNIAAGNLNYAGTAVTSTGTELNLLDGSNAGTIVNSKALVYGSSGEVNATILQIAGTSITSDATELNLLDGVSGLVQADLTKLAAVDATAAELNIMDGGTSATGTTVADADRVVLNDGGTMVQAAVTDLDTYVSGTTKTLTNKTLTAPKFADGGFIADDSGNEYIEFTKTSSAINELNITNSDATNPVIIGATGGDSNIDITLNPKGTGEVNIAAGNLNYAGTAVTSTGAELNIMDGGTSATGTTVADADRVVLNDGGTMVQVAMTDISTYISANSATLTNKTLSSPTLNTPTITGNTDFSDGSYNFDILSHDGTNGLALASTVVTSTGAELNIMDGGTSATGTTVADADRVVLNDGGTMVQAAVTDLAAYFDDEITAMPNLITTAATTVGALNSGSITDGFTSIDVGSGAVTTTGTLTYGTLNDGTTDLGSTTAELNIMDGGTSATGTTVADADRVVLNDGGTMVQAAVTDLAAYFDDEITAMPNLITTAATTVGALNSGSITDGFTSIDVGSGAVTTTGTLTYGTLNDGTTDLGSTTAELNIMDGGTSATGTTVADADRVVLNDGGTMVQAAGNRFRYVCIGNNKDFNKQNINGSKVCGWWIYCRWKW